jgi:hypothetical protein
MAPVMICLMLCLYVIGCGNATGGGGGGGGGATLSADIYVSTTGSDEPGRGTQSDPYKTIQYALNMAGNSKIIGVYEGIYNEHITWPTWEALTLKGISATGVLVSGEFNGRVINIETGTPNQTITIETLTVTAGAVGEIDGAGIRMSVSASNVNLHLKGINITGNSGSVEGGAGSGGGIYINNIGEVLIEDCDISNNSARNGGGLMIIGDCTLKNCSIRNNLAKYTGGIDQAANFTLTMESCVVSDNVANVSSTGSGAGIFILYKATLTNCLIYNNRLTGTGGYGGGVSFYNSPSAGAELNIINCTIVSNDASATGHGGGVSKDGTTMDVNIINSIIWGNIGNTGSSISDVYHDVSVSYSDIKQWNSSIVNGAGTLEAVNPVFKGIPPYDDPTDFKLTGSTTTDVTHGGTTEGAPSTDYAGTARAGHISMGAWQH